MPCRSASAFSARRPSAGRSPADADEADPLAEGRDAREGVLGEVDEPAAERSTVVDYHGDGGAGGQVGDRDVGAEREPGARGREAVVDVVPGGLSNRGTLRG